MNPSTPKRFVTAREITISGFRGGSAFPKGYEDFKVPAGLRCKPIMEGSTSGKFWLDELPRDIFPPNSFIRHDATHYGVVIEEADVVEA
jgi:hypothetical protein